MPSKQLQKMSLHELPLSSEPEAGTELVISDGFAYVLPSQHTQCQSWRSEANKANSGQTNNSCKHGGFVGTDDSSDIRVLVQLHAKLALRLSQTSNSSSLQQSFVAV